MSSYELRIGTPEDFEWPAPDVVFSSDFGTALGDYDSGAWQDGGKWVQGSAGLLDVILSTGLNWPSPNILRVSANDTTGSVIPRSATPIPVPAVGGHLFYRWYWRYAANAWAGSHCIQDGTSSPTLNWSFNQSPLGGGQHRANFAFNSNQDANPSPNGAWGASLVWENDTTYRWEVHIHRTDTASMVVEVRVYLVAGGGIANGGTETLVAETPDFLNSNGDPLSEYVGVIRPGNLNSFATLHIGQNTDPGSAEIVVHSYQGAFCVRTDDWCGHYRNGV